MRHKQDILNSTHLNALKTSCHEDVALIHSLHTLEVLIDIRDVLNDLNQTIDSKILDLSK